MVEVYISLEKKKNRNSLTKNYYYNIRRHTKENVLLIVDACERKRDLNNSLSV